MNNFAKQSERNLKGIELEKADRIDDEIRVLEKAVWVFENTVYEKRSDRLPKLEKI